MSLLSAHSGEHRAAATARRAAAGRRDFPKANGEKRELSILVLQDTERGINPPLCSFAWG